MIWWPGFCSQLFAPDTRLIGKNLEHSLTMAGKCILKPRCPICKKIVKSSAPEFPFCSDRCRTIDLGKWASGASVIASPITAADEQICESTPEDSGEDL